MAKVTETPSEIWRIGYSLRHGMSGGGHIEFFQSRDEAESLLRHLRREVISGESEVSNLTIHRHSTTEWEQFEWNDPSPSIVPHVDSTD